MSGAVAAGNAAAGLGNPTPPPLLAIRLARRHGPHAVTFLDEKADDEQRLSSSPRWLCQIRALPGAGFASRQGLIKDRIWIRRVCRVVASRCILPLGSAERGRDTTQSPAEYITPLTPIPSHLLPSPAVPSPIRPQRPPRPRSRQRARMQCQPAAARETCRPLR